VILLTQTLTAVEDLKKLIREIPDYPKPGVLFYDITTLIKDRAGFARVVDFMTSPYLDKNVDLVLGMEARGFIFGSAVAYRLNAGFIPVRKPKKLPFETVSYPYDLEYGTDTLEIHKDAIQPGQRVLIVDDLLATGGTAEAAAKLATKLEADICGFCFVVELDFLHGRKRLAPYEVFSLLHYDE
jgi:adenine phosphoribosyltransferase